jgi:hypothetical protein
MKTFQFPDNAERSRKEGFGATVHSLYQPDIVLPFQYFELFHRNAYLEAEKRLMLAVLEDAVACFQKYHSAQDKKGKKLFQEVDEWIRSKDDDWLFSFEYICETLAVNPDYVRRGLLAWKEKQPLSQRFGQSKGAKRFSERANILRGRERRKLLSDPDNKSEERDPQTGDLVCLQSVETRTGVLGSAVSMAGG